MACYNLFMETKPIKFDKDLFLTFTESIKEQLEAKGIKEEEILAEFEELREIPKQVQNDIL